MSNRLSQHYRSMAYNNAWANFRLVKACAQLSQEDYVATRTSFFPSIKSTLNHLLTVDWVYVEALDREARGEKPHPNSYVFFTPREPFDTCAGWAAEQAKVDRRLIDYCNDLQDADFDRIVTILRPAGPIHENRSRLLAHLFQHQIHHRGQAHAMLSGTKVEAPQLDDFFRETDADLRAQDFAELGWVESDIWGK